jgi:hypothetical protein
MTAQRIRRTGTVQVISQRMALRFLAVSVGLAAAAATFSAPAQADPVSDAFLSALNNAGVSYNDPATTVALGQSICPMLVQPGGNFATVASSMAGNNGISANMAGLFTSIAIGMYCPTMMSSFANGNMPMPIPFQIPGLGG